IAVGQPAKAVTLLQETLALREQRVKAAPNNTVEQSFLALTHGQMGEAEQARQDYATAARAYFRSVEMFEKLDRVGSLTNPFFRKKLELYRERLEHCRKAEQAAKNPDAVREWEDFKKPLTGLEPAKKD